MKMTLLVATLFLCVSSAFSQTVADLNAKFGKPMEVYSVSEHIWMAPEFGTNGQICEVRFFPKRIDNTTNYLSQKLPFEELTKVLNELVPLDQRGAKQTSFGTTATGGPAAWTTYGYEKVRFVFISSFPALGFDNSPPLRKGDFVFSPEIAPATQGTENSAPADDDFRNSRRSDIDIVSIRWNDRKCGLN